MVNKEKKLTKKIIGRIDHLTGKTKKITHHVWMIEEWDERDGKWEIAGDSQGQYRIFGMRSAARYWLKHEFAHDPNYRTGNKRKLRVRKYVRLE